MEAQMTIPSQDNAGVDLFRRAAAVVVSERRASTSLIQRRLGIGYNKAARLVERMEEQGIVGAPDHVGKREVATRETIQAAIDISSIVSADSEAPRMRETPEDVEVRDKAYRVTGEELRQFVESYERLEQDKKDIAEHQKEVMAEAKGRGYDTKIIKKVIALRKREPDDIAEEEAVLDMYKQALGMS